MSDSMLDLSWEDPMCPCDVHRRLDEEEKPEQWEAIYTACVLLAMFAFLLTDRFGSDSVMMLALTMFLVAGVLDVKQAMSGFASEGLWTVVILFCVAGGISATGALDWYVGKMLGEPKTSMEAQWRLLVPTVILSAFTNNTPQVAIMIPIVARWAKKNNIAPQQLFIPLSYGSELGGTCTLIGTSTNLVVTGMLTDKYGDTQGIGLFDIALYGVPICIIGTMYIILASPFVLPGSNNHRELYEEDVLLKAKVNAWSPAVNRTVRRSGLRDTGGIYLVSVERSATGNIHRAVSPDFVINVGDVLHFTGLAESFGNFCDEHGLTIVTADSNKLLLTEKEESSDSEELGTTWQSIKEADTQHCMREVAHLSDLIHGIASDKLDPSSPHRVIIYEDHDMIVIGVDAPDRAGILMDITKVLGTLSAQLHNTEAAVVGARSLSVWRVSSRSLSKHLAVTDIWNAVHTTLSGPSGDIVKHSGLLVIRAKVTEESSLIGKVVTDVDFRGKYDASLVSLQQNGRNVAEKWSTVTLKAGDLLVLYAERTSPVLNGHETEHHEDEEHGGRFTGDLEVQKEQQHTDISEGEFLSAMVILKRSAFVGKSVLQSGINSLTGVTLVSIERKIGDHDDDKYDSHSKSSDGGRVPTEAVGFDEPVLEGDILWYAGPAWAIGDLRKIPGLGSYHEAEVKQIGDHVHVRRLVQAVVAPRGPLVGKSVRDLKFRTHYGAVIIAVQRGGKRLHTYPGQVVLQGGDVLLLEAGPSFVADKVDESGRAFTMLLDVEDSAPPRLHMLWPALIIMTGMLLVAALEYCSLLTSALVATFLMIALGIISEDEARKSIIWDVYVVIGAALGIGTAMVESGLADILADFVVEIGNGLGIGDAGLYGAVYLATAMVSNVVTNNAAAALVFPVALEAADKFGADRRLMAYTLMFGASACFASPFGYQTNLMVFVPGRYRTIDFVKLGAPMQVVMFIWSVLVLTVFDPWSVSWTTSFAAFFVMTFFIFGGSALIKKTPKDEKEETRVEY